MNKEYIEEVRSHFNEPMLMVFDVCRCVGYAEDDDDCYILVREPRPNDDRVRWHTFVGGYVFLDRLKGQNHCKSPTTGEEWDDFTILDKVLALNGAPREPEFICIDRSTYETERTGEKDSVRLDNSVQEGTRSVENLHPGTDDGSTGVVVSPI